MKTETLIIGAGVYGIGLANHLFCQNRKFIIVGKFMDLWRNHTLDSMELRSDFSTSEIAHPKNRFSANRFLKDHEEFSRYRNQHLPVFVYRAYLKWVKANLEYPVIDDLVKSLDVIPADHQEGRQKFRFCAMLKKGKKQDNIYAQKVVIATGLSDHVYIPPEINSSLQKIIHSYDTQKIEKLKRKNILVIGGGQSAAETIESLQNQKNNVSWYSRHLPVYLEQPVNIPSWLFSLIVKSANMFYHCPPGLRRALIQFLSKPTIRPRYKFVIDNTKKISTIKNMTSVKNNFDAIVVATGFQTSIDNLSFLSSKIKSIITQTHGSPLLNKYFESTCPGLYFAGGIAEASFGPALRFIIGSHYAANKISTDFGNSGK